MTETEHCPHCPDGHDNPNRKPWGVYVGAERDGDGQPVNLHVGPSNCSHVAESDAEWLRQVIRDAQAAANAAAVPSGAEQPTYCPRCHGDGIDPDCDGRDEFHHFACTACDGSGRAHQAAVPSGAEEASEA